MICLKNKRIIITGAGSGIGRETAICASQLGATIIMIDITEIGLKETLALLCGSGHSYYVTDLSNIESINKVEINVGLDKILSESENDDINKNEQNNVKDIQSLKNVLSSYYEIDSKKIKISVK